MKVVKFLFSMILFVCISCSPSLEEQQYKSVQKITLNAEKTNLLVDGSVWSYELNNTEVFPTSLNNLSMYTVVNNTICDTMTVALMNGDYYVFE